MLSFSLAPSSFIIIEIPMGTEKFMKVQRGSVAARARVGGRPDTGDDPVHPRALRRCKPLPAWPRAGGEAISLRPCIKYF